MCGYTAQVSAAVLTSAVLLGSADTGDTMEDAVIYSVLCLPLIFCCQSSVGDIERQQPEWINRDECAFSFYVFTHPHLCASQEPVHQWSITVIKGNAHTLEHLRVHIQHLSEFQGSCVNVTDECKKTRLHIKVHHHKPPKPHSCALTDFTSHWNYTGRTDPFFF